MDRVTVMPNFGTAQTLDELKRMLTKHWSEMANLVNNSFTLYVQNTQPTIPNNTTSLWQNTTTTPNRYYLVSNFGGAHSVIQLTSDGRPEIQKARAYRNAAMNVNGDTKITIDTDSYDPANITDLTNNRILPTIVGYYQVNGQISIADLPTANSAQVKLLKNGLTVAYGTYSNNDSGADRIINCTISDIIYCDGIDDYIELSGWTTTTAALSVGDSGVNYLSVVGPF